MPLTFALFAPAFLVGIALILFGPILIELLPLIGPFILGFRPKPATAPLP